MRVLKALFVLVLVALAGLAGWLYVAPPELIRVASDYSAKIVCSNAFLTGRDPQEVFEIDVRTHGHPLLKVMNVSVDREAGVVRAGLFGLFGRGLALHREGQGCATVPDGDLTAARAAPALPPPEPAEPGEGLWPAGETVEPSDNAALRAALDDPALTGPGMRAVVVVKDGRIVGERYGDGFDAETRLLGWSMTKTVTSAVIGTLIREGRLSLEDRDLFAGWKDGRADIALSDMLGMASDLAWNEEYGSVSDVLRMLYLEPDMAGFAPPSRSMKPRPAASARCSTIPPARRSCCRASGRTLRHPCRGARLAARVLFDPLGMRSAVLETDARGTFVGSSYLYATARDWARFGPVPVAARRLERPLAAAGRLCRLDGGGSSGLRRIVWPRPCLAQPAETLWLPGRMPICPPTPFHVRAMTVRRSPSSRRRDLVVVRLGLTPNKLGYKPGHLMEA
jgi:hypothetical protein